MEGRVITGSAEFQLRELLVRALRLLQADDVWFAICQPRQQAVLPLAQRVDIPGDDSH